MGKRLAVLVCAVLAFSAIPAHAATVKTALIYGDSLVWESASPTAKAFGRGWQSYNASYPSTAPCDWLVGLDDALTTYRPQVVTMATAGNTGFTCMAGISPATPEYFARYRADLDAFFSKVTESGAQMVFVEDPPMLDPQWNADIAQIITIAVDLADNYHGVTIYKNARAQLSYRGQYVSHKKCLKAETADMGCRDGSIAVRTVTGDPAQIGVHLCPDGLTFPDGCDMYSSGELRFGRAIAGATKHPDPVLP